VWAAGVFARTGAMYRLPQVRALQAAGLVARPDVRAFNRRG
jgi:hypothetical protein